MSKISIVMPSHLNPYVGSASQRREKFRRAVQSFLQQTYVNKELVVVSDDCNATEEIIQKHFLSPPNIKLLRVSKQPLFSGNVREVGLRAATGEIICYLDSDDTIGENHLSNIVNNFNTEYFDWVFFDDKIRYHHLEHLPLAEREVSLTAGMAGTSCIAHKNLPNISWDGANGYGHDWTFISRLMAQFPRYTKIIGGEYIVCHIPNTCDS